MTELALREIVERALAEVGIEPGLVQPPTGRPRVTTWSSEIRGFGVRYYPSGRKVYVGKVIGDHVGITADGKPILIECKSSKSGRRPTACRFEPHQKEFLLGWEARGGLALIAWSSVQGGVSYCNASEILIKPTRDTP